MKVISVPLCKVPAGFAPVTTPIYSHERWMVPRIVGDLERGGVRSAVVPVRTKYGTNGVEVWRGPAREV